MRFIICFLLILCIISFNKVSYINRYNTSDYIKCNYNGKICDIYFIKDIKETDKYLEAIYLLDSSKSDVTLNLHVSGSGGPLSTIYYLYNSIKSSRANINTDIDGPVYSADAFLAMMGTHINIKPVAFFMFHSPGVYNNETKEYVSPESICVQYKGTFDRGQDGEKKCLDNMEFLSNINQIIFKDKIYPYLTSEEILKIQQGYDVYISGEDMNKRLNK